MYLSLTEISKIIDICMATEAGFVTFQGLPGKIKTGCLMIPDYKSRYCSLHKPRVCQKPVNDGLMSRKNLCWAVSKVQLRILAGT